MEITKNFLDDVFFNDGSLRDIYVLDVDINDWQIFLNWILSTHWAVAFYKDGQVKVYEKTEATHLFDEKKNSAIKMSIDIMGIIFNCYFFSEDELEFDIQPKEVRGVTEAIEVFKFMRELSKILGKEIILTEENTPEYPLVTVKPDGELIINNS